LADRKTAVIVALMPEPVPPEKPISAEKLSSDPFFWVGIFASPVLSCLFFALGGLASNASQALVLAFAPLLLLSTFVGIFYCGFKLGWRCTQHPGGRVVLSLLFSLGFFVFDFAVFFFGCCAGLSFA